MRKMMCMIVLIVVCARARCKYNCFCLISGFAFKSVPSNSVYMYAHVCVQGGAVKLMQIVSRAFKHAWIGMHVCARRSRQGTGVHYVYRYAYWSTMIKVCLLTCCPTCISLCQQHGSKTTTWRNAGWHSMQSLNAIWMLFECYLNAIWMLFECYLNAFSIVKWMNLNCMEGTDETGAFI